MPLRMFVVGRQVERLCGGKQCVERGGFRLRRQAGGPVFIDGGAAVFIGGNAAAELQLLRDGGQIVAGIGQDIGGEQRGFQFLVLIGLV